MTLVKSVAALPQKIRDHEALVGKLDNQQTHLNALQAEWMSAQFGVPLGAQMTHQQRTEALSMLNSCWSRGNASETLTIIRRLLAHYPGYNVERPDSVAEDWVQELIDRPVLCIWIAYKKTICSKGQFAPTLGTFLDTVSGLERWLQGLERTVSALK